MTAANTAQHARGLSGSDARTRRRAKGLFRAAGSRGVDSSSTMAYHLIR